MIPDLLLLRHGETAWNREGRMQGDRLDSPLTALGRAQSRAMASVLAGLGAHPSTHAALTSPLGRAVATADLALTPLGLRPRADARLVEMGVGAWAGLARAEIDRRWPPPAGESLFGYYARCEGGEGLAALNRRAEAVLADLDGPTVIVTHGITLRVLAALAAGHPAEAGGDWPRLPQGVVVRVRDGRIEAFDVEGHLDWGPPTREAAGLPASGAGVNPGPSGG